MLFLNVFAGNGGGSSSKRGTAGTEAPQGMRRDSNVRPGATAILRRDSNRRRAIGLNAGQRGVRGARRD